MGRESRTSFFTRCNLNFFPPDQGCLSRAKLCLMSLLYFLGRLSHQVYLRSQVSCSEFSHYENYRVHLGLVCPAWMAVIPFLKHPVMKSPPPLTHTPAHSHTHITWQDSILNANKCLWLILFAFLVNHLYYSTSLSLFPGRMFHVDPTIKFQTAREFSTRGVLGRFQLLWKIDEKITTLGRFQGAHTIFDHPNTRQCSFQL